MSCRRKIWPSSGSRVSSNSRICGSGREVKKNFAGTIFETLTSRESRSRVAYSLEHSSSASITVSASVLYACVCRIGSVVFSIVDETAADAREICRGPCERRRQADGAGGDVPHA